MKRSFREYHLFQILDSFEKMQLPLDSFLRSYFLTHKAVGSKDRKYLADTIYGLIRWRGLLDYLSPEPSWENRFKAYQKFDPFENNPTLPSHIRVSFPKSFFQHLVKCFGEDKAIKICFHSNSQAPTTIRANMLKTTRDELLKKWKDLYDVTATTHAECGITFNKKINFFALPEFKEGLFEVQDEASQLIANLVKAEPGQQVLDFCAGSGGKTLAFSPKMQGKGQIYLHDIRPYILKEAKKRLKRAGIQNAQLLFYDDSKKDNLKNRMDWVLCDAPCSGSGTLRRNPDMKWKFDVSSLPRLVEEQRNIFEKALEFLHPKGKIVYATCSIFPEENEEQVSYFQKKYNLQIVGEPFRSMPEKGGMDGFFGAVFSKKISPNFDL